MFRRARLSVKPNVRPGVSTRGSAASNPQRGPETPRPPEPAAESAPKPAEPTDVPAVDSRGAESQKKAPGSSNEKAGDENNVEESSKSSSTVSQRRKRVSSTSSVVRPAVSVPSQSHPLSPVNHDAPQPNPAPAKDKQPNPAPAKDKQPCSDRYRIYKARKLREMLKEELRKEKKQWKNKFATNESQGPPDRSKMTMRDFIYYLPDNNPMTSSLEQEKKTEKPLAPTPARDKQDNQSTQDADDNEDVEEEADDGPLLVPRVKVAEDGSIILDEESLTVEVLRTKGPCVVEENDPIFERGSTTTYSSFRKNYYSKPWSNKETDMFFLAISMVGTDFSMIGQLFPHRARIEIKNKFKREEKANGWRIDKAFQEKRPFDFDFFAHLLQKVLAEEEKRKQKSTKCQSLKEKASKPRKTTKAKKVTSEEVDDDPDESVNSNTSDPERSQKNAETVDEEESPSSSGQHLEQVMLEQDQNQEKRRNQDEAKKQEAAALLGNVLVHSSSPEAETHNNTYPSEENESECNMEEIPSCIQNTEDLAGSASSEKVEMRMEPASPTCTQQDIIPLASESSGSSVGDVPVSGAGRAVSSEVKSAEHACTEEGSADTKNKSPETEQAENVKPKSRSRLQRPKPNLSRAVGKKSVVSQDKQDERSKNSSSESSTETNLMEEDRMNVSDNFGIDNKERENPGAETVSDLSEKSHIQEDSQPKVLRPARLMRSRMQRPKPNVEKAAERKEILTSQDQVGAHAEKSKVDESCVDREKNESCVEIPQQVENDSNKNCQSEDSISQPEKKDTLENVQSDEPNVLSDCSSTQEGNKANKAKQAPVLRIRFQKPKPNTRRRRRVSSKSGVPEEIPDSGDIASTLEEIARPDVSLREEAPDVATLIATPSMKELDSDLKDTGRNDTSSNMKISEMTDVTVEMETGLETVGRDISPGQMGAEMIDIPMETETSLKASSNEFSPMEKVPELIDTTGEIYTSLGETGRKEIFLQENGSKEVSPVSEVAIGLQEAGEELPRKERTPDMTDSTEEREAHSEDTGREESALMEDAEEAKAMEEMETHLEEMGTETSQRQQVAEAPVEQRGNEVHICSSSSREDAEVEVSLAEEKDLTSLMVMAPGEMTATEESDEGLKETEREISVSWERGSGEVCVGEEMVADVGKIDVSLREHEPEEHTSKQPKADVIQSRSDNDSSTGPSLDGKNNSSKISVMPVFMEEQENADKEVSGHSYHVESSSQNSGYQKTDQGIQLPDAQEQFPDANLSTQPPQEPKPLEVKPAPFLRSRLKKPKPNLSRAALKRAPTEAKPCVPGKKSEGDRMETLILQQDREQVESLSLHHNVPSLMVSRENDKPGHEAEEAVIPSSVQTEKEPSPPNSCEPKEDSQSTQNQEDGLVVPIGTQKMNMVTQETKQSVQITLPVRGRLQRPKPNIQKARQRQIVERGEAGVIAKNEGRRETGGIAKNEGRREAGGIAKNEGTELQKDETDKCLTLANSHIESEVEVFSRISECRLEESQAHVVPVENLSINRTNVSDEQIRHENKPHVPSPAPLIRRRFQKVKPNLGGAQRKREQPGVEKDTTDPSTAPNPEDNVLQKGDCDVQLSLKEKTEIPVPLEVSAREDCIGPEDSGSARKDTQLKVGLSGGPQDEMAEGQPASSSRLEEQGLSKQISSPHLLKESNHSTTSPLRRTTISSASECEADPGKRTHRKMKPATTKGRASKRPRGKTVKKEPRASKSTLVTLRASQKEDEDDFEDFATDYEEETCHLAPEELNKAPVFVPVGLRSPEPVSAQIEETMEELEITMNVADIGCPTVVEHKVSDMDVSAQDVQPEEVVHPSPFEMVIGEQTQEEPGLSDGSTEAAITLLTMGDIVLQSEGVIDQHDVGVCVFPDVHSKDKSHVPFSPDNVSHKIVHEYQEVSSPVISMSPAPFEENKIVSKEQSTREEADVMEEMIKDTLSTRNAASTMTADLSMESKCVTSVTPKPNSEEMLEISGLNGGLNQEATSFCITKGTEVEIQRETKENDSKAIEVEDKSLEPVTVAEAEEQNQLLCVHDAEGTRGSQEAFLSARNEDHEESLQEVQLPGAAVASFVAGFPTLDSGQGLGVSPAEEPLKDNPKGSSMLMLPVPESVPSTIPEIQQEHMISRQDGTVNLFANLQQDGEDEQAFILTLVEIPTTTTEGFTDASMQLMPSSLLPAPILVRSGNTVETSDLRSLQATSVVEDATFISPSGSGDSEQPSASLDLTSRKRFRCSPDESIHVPPAKKSSITPGVDCQECASEVCSKELNVFEKTEESCTGQGIFPTSENPHTTSEPQKEHDEPTFQKTESSGSLDEIKDAGVEVTMTQLPQDKMVSDKEEKTDPASNSEQRASVASSSKRPLTRPGRRPLGFLSLICPKNSLESEEMTQTHSKKRLKPQIPISRRNLKKSNPLNASQKKSPESPAPLSSPSVTEAQSDSTGILAAETSSNQPLQKEKGKNKPKGASEEEVTTVSEFVFDNIFIEVDETE